MKINKDIFLLSDFSRGINREIFDATVSQRTTKGLKKTFKLDDKTMSDQTGEHIVYATMIVPG